MPYCHCGVGMVIAVVAMFLAACLACHAIADTILPDVEKRVVRQWQVMELSFRARHQHTCPLDEVEMTAEFRGPGVCYRICGFYDGQDVWKVRFSPPAAGDWAFRTICNCREAGLNDIAGRFCVLAPSPDEKNAVYRHGGFLAVSADGHYLTYTDGTPFFWLGDTWWCVPSKLVPLDSSNRLGIPSLYNKLLETRKRQRFTIVHMAFVEKPGEQSLPPYMRIADGVFDESYWRGADRYIGQANDAGLIPVIGLGFYSKGVEQPDLARLQRVWSYVLARYGAHAVSFLICGEYNVATGPDRAYSKQDLAWIETVLALGRYIEARDPYRRAMTVHPWYYAGDGGQAREEAWCDLVMVQGGHSGDCDGGPDPCWYRQIYDRPHPKPLVEGERTYEGIFGAGAGVVRRSAYLAIQSGCCGYTYGAHGLWYPTQDEHDKTFSEWGPAIPWWQAIEQPGGQQMKYLRDAYEMLDWWVLRPIGVDQAMELPAQMRDGDKPLVKADAGRTQLLVYLPASSAPREELYVRGLVGGAGYKRIQFDPRTGQHLEERVNADAAGRISLSLRGGNDDAVVIFCRQD